MEDGRQEQIIRRAAEGAVRESLEQVVERAVRETLKTMEREAGRKAEQTEKTEIGQEVLLTLETAKKLAGEVERKAKEMGLPVVIAVSDASARPIAVHCMDGAYIASFDIALHKAYTSAGLKMSTAELSRLSAPGQPLYGIQNTNDGKIVIFGGGEVLERNGQTVGALGVSGGTLEQDTALAAYGKEMFGRIL